MSYPIPIGTVQRGLGWLALGAASALLFGSEARAYNQPLNPVVCHCSGLHDQCDSTLPLALNGQPPFNLELCIDLNPDGYEASAPGRACKTTDPGMGSEICAWHVEIVADPEMIITSYGAPQPAPQPPLPPVVSGWDTGSVRINRVTASIQGEYQVAYLGTFALSPTVNCAGCALRVHGGKSIAYDASSTRHSIEPSIIALPEPGGLALLVSGIGLLAVAHRRRQRRTRGAGGPRRRIATVTALCALAAPMLPPPADAELAVVEAALDRVALGTLPTGGRYGDAIARLGDLDGDGVEDLAVGNRDASPSLNGAVRILFPYSDGAIRKSQLINEGNGGFGGLLPLGASFGSSVASLGDLDGNGAIDLAVGGAGATDLWILFLNADGTVKGHVAHSIDAGRSLTTALASVGDVDVDGVDDLAVGKAHIDCSIGVATRCGAVELLMLNSNGTIKSSLTIDDATVSGLSTDSGFGGSLTALGDINGDGAPDFAAGVPGVGASGSGDVAIVRMNELGTVQGTQLLIASGAGLPYVLAADAHFGASLSPIGDVDGNGVTDLAVGAYGVPTSGGVPQLFAGAVYLLNLDANAASVVSIVEAEVIDDSITGLANAFASNTQFGIGIGLVDADSDGEDELWVGAESTASGSTGGYLWTLALGDADDDGVPDYVDNCPSVRNASQTNSDTDDLGDLCDNCPLVSNPSQSNTDGGPYGDLCEPPEILLTANGDPATPAWDLSIRCNSAYVRRVNIGVLMNDMVDHADVRVGGGCEEPVPPVGTGSGCDAGEASLLGNVINLQESGVFYIPGASHGEREDTLFTTFVGDAYEGGILLCEPGITELLAVVDIVPRPVGLSAFPHFGLSPDGGGAIQSDFETPAYDPDDIPIPKVITMYVASLDPIELELEMQVVENNPGQYQICFKGVDHMRRISFGLEPPYLPNTSVHANLEVLGCNVTPNGTDGAFDCESNMMPSHVEPDDSFVMKPTSAYASGNNLDENRLYGVFEGNVGGYDPFAPPLNEALGIEENDPSTCVATVQVSGGTSEPPIFYVDYALDDLPFRTIPAGAFLEIDNTAVLDTWVATVNFGLDDVDDDSISDETDNCTYTPNTTQLNTGALHNQSPVSFGFGDACECGSEEMANGSIVPGDSDLQELQKVLAGAATTDPDAEARCSVDGNATCDLADALLLDQALSDTQLPLGPSCTAANGE